MSKRTLFTYFSNSSNVNGSTSTPNTGESTNVERTQRLIENTSENRLVVHEPKRGKVEFSFSDIVGDPGNRKPIEHYAFEIRDQVKRAYALGGLTQPINHSFPRRWQSGEWRSFQSTWYDKFDWLEYSVSKDAAYCLYCYLFFEPAKPSKFGRMCSLSLVIPIRRRLCIILRNIKLITMHIYFKWLRIFNLHIYVRDNFN